MSTTWATADLKDLRLCASVTFLNAFRDLDFLWDFMAAGFFATFLEAAGFFFDVLEELGAEGFLLLPAFVAFIAFMLFLGGTLAEVFITDFFIGRALEFSQNDFW